MEKHTEETRSTQENNNDPVENTPTKREATNPQTAGYVVYFILGALEILLAFRLVLKLLGASVSSSFVNAIYDLSGIFISPFEGIFRRGVSEGIETASVLEPSTIVAMIVYAIIAWGIIQIIAIFTGEKPEA